MLQWILLVILKNNSWFLLFLFILLTKIYRFLHVEMGRRCFSFLPLTSSFFSIYFCEEKFNNAKILITSRDVGVETGIERGRRRDETKAFYCVLNHKMRFSSSIKSKSSRKNNIFLANLARDFDEHKFRFRKHCWFTFELRFKRWLSTI